MATAAARARSDGARARVALRARLEARRDEIEAAALTRIKAISDPGEVSDPAYAEGLRAAVAAAIDYGLEATGRSAENAPPIPVALLAQARLAARVGIPLDTVLRRYFAGYSLLGYFLMEEASREGLMDGAALQRLVAAHAGTFDRLLAAIGEEHARESETRQRSTERRQAERIERLLGGEIVETSGIAYDFEGWHLGVVASGDGSEQAIRDLASPVDCQTLLVPRQEGLTWAWLGSRHEPDSAKLARPRSSVAPMGASLALGEPGEGLAGWRLTHSQAAAALPVAQRSPGSVARYADVAFLAATLRDETLAASLRKMYLAPLRRERDEGRAIKETLRAYLEAGRNVSSTAASLGVKRHTVTNRLRSFESAVGRSLDGCMVEVETALRLDELDERNRAAAA